MVSLDEKLRRARALAWFFAGHEEVQEVWAFGSIAREEESESTLDHLSDIDLILVVAEEVADTWFNDLALEAEGRDSDVYAGREARYYRALQTLMISERDGLGVLFSCRHGMRREEWCVRQAAWHALHPDEARLKEDPELVLQFTPADLFLVPPDWRDRLDELQNLLPAKDPQLFRHIAAEARRFDFAAHPPQLLPVTA